MHPGEKEPYIPPLFPLRKWKRSAFLHAHGQAEKSLHQFQQLLAQIPKPHQILSCLMATEALAALESQKIKLSLDEFFYLCQTRKHPQKKLLQPTYYFNALKKASRAIQNHSMDKKLLCAIHEMVKKGAPPHIQAGNYRSKQNWIGPEGCKKEDAYFFPPAPKVMRIAMQNLFAYMKKPEKDVLTQIALIIAQLLIIHPFMDGNGRVARITVPLLIYQKKALSHPLVFMSRYLKDHRARYFRNLFDITGEGQWEQWIRFFLKGVARQAALQRKKAEMIYALYLKLKKSHARCLYFIFSQPVFARSQFLQRYSTTLLKQLLAQRIIKPYKRGYCTFPALLKILKSKNLER